MENEVSNAHLDVSDDDSSSDEARSAYSEGKPPVRLDEKNMSILEDCIEKNDQIFAQRAEEMAVIKKAKE